MLQKIIDIVHLVAISLTVALLALLLWHLLVWPPAPAGGRVIDQLIGDARS